MGDNSYAQSGISHEEEIAKLRAENARLDRLAWDYRGEITQAQEEIARLQSDVDELDRMIRAEITTSDKVRAQIAALREQWQARYDAWKVEFDEEMQKAGRAERSLILAGQRYAMACVLEELDELFPPESPA